MFGQFATNKSIEKYLALFGGLFSQIRLVRQSPDGDIQQQTVPIAFVGNERYDTRAQQDPTGNKQIAMQLPRMAYDLIDVSYDSDRQLNPMAKEVMFSATNNPVVHYQPSPWTLIISLEIRTRNQTDMFQIFEQIVPYFNPTFSLKSILLDGTNCPINVDISLLGVSIRNTVEGALIGPTKEQVWSITFAMKTWIFGPDVSGVGSNIQIKWVSNTTTENNGEGYSSNTSVFSPTINIGDLQQTDPHVVVINIEDIP